MNTAARNIKITLAYDGTEFHGWQVQPGLRTIQGALEQALLEIEGCAVAVCGSGRTDAGVHARGQVASFQLVNPIPLSNLGRALNRLLPRSIRVLAVEPVSESFHARFSARWKTYEYRIWRGEICPPLERLYVYHHPYPLDEARMCQLAPLFEGEHDFSAFAAADEKDELGFSKVRTMSCSQLERREEILLYRVRGSGFLKHMVRMMIGTLLEAGKGNMDRDQFLLRLKPGHCGKAGRSVPASGLSLISVEYDDLEKG
jgi:tRNA pseudouridine38-40 synthase